MNRQKRESKTQMETRDGLMIAGTGGQIKEGKSSEKTDGAQIMTGLKKRGEGHRKNGGENQAVKGQGVRSV